MIKKPKRQDLHRRVRLDEGGDRARGRHQHDHRQDHRHRHDPDLVGHADRGDDAVDREYQVDDRDLGHHRREVGQHPGTGLALVALERAVDLLGRLVDQEQPAGGQDQILARDAVPEQLEQRLGQADDPADEEQQHQPREQRQGHADIAGLAWRAFGSLPTRTAITTRLSMLKTTSSTVKVSRLSQTCGSDSIVVFQCENRTGTVMCSSMERVVPPSIISRRREWP